jgi:hypothetical protein
MAAIDHWFGTAIPAHSSPANANERLLEHSLYERWLTIAFAYPDDFNSVYFHEALGHRITTSHCLQVCRV